VPWARAPLPTARSLSSVGKGPRRAADLYGLPLEEFTAARNELVRELKRAGKKEAADEVGVLRKPTRSTWAVNQVARRRPQETRALVKAGDELRKAQRAVVAGRDSEVLAQAQRKHRSLLDELTETAREVLDEHGPASSVLTQAVQTLRGASIEKETAKDLVRGTLAEEVEQSGFGPLLAAVPSGPRKARAAPKPKAKPQRKPPAKPKPPPKPKPDPNIARRARLQQQLDRARERVSELEARLDELGG
jgi:hypothetical protein